MNTVVPTLRNVSRRNAHGLSSYPSFSNFIDDIINDSFGVQSPLTSHRNSGLPAVNIIENERAFELEVAAPGYKKSDFKIDIEEQTLKISSERTSKEEENTDRFTRREFAYTSFQRSFHLPETVDQEAITAQYTDGILKVTLTKKEEAIDKGPRQIEVL
jgi:HSP20 family protein